MRNRRELCFFRPSTIGAAHLVWAGSVTLSDNIWAISFSSNARFLLPAMYSTEWISFASSGDSPIRYFAILARLRWLSHIDSKSDNISMILSNSTYTSSILTLSRQSCFSRSSLSFDVFVGTHLRFFALPRFVKSSSLAFVPRPFGWFARLLCKLRDSAPCEITTFSRRWIGFLEMFVTKT